MFNTFATYLLGGNANTNDLSNKENKNIVIFIDEATKKPIKADIKYKESICDEDEDWLIIDPAESEESLTRTESEEDLAIVQVKTRSPAFKTKSHKNSRGRNQKNKKPKCINSMEESWFVTPPPCFTSTGPILVETSPLENLLIEHPSMSVYHSIRNSSAQDIAEDIVILDIDLSGYQNSDENNAAQGRVSTRNRIYRIEQYNNQQSRQLSLFKSAQKLQERKHRQTLCRNAIERSNKTHELNTKGGHQKRSDLQNARNCSRANNNRKC